MTQQQSALPELADALSGTDATLTPSITDIMATVLQELIEAELTARIGAEPGERSPARTNLRNGHRPKLVSTAAGDVELAIPKLRSGSFFPELLEPRRRIDSLISTIFAQPDGDAARTQLRVVVDQPANVAPTVGERLQVMSCKSFPTPNQSSRPFGALLVEVSDELIAAPRRYMAAVTLIDLIDDAPRATSAPSPHRPYVRRRGGATALPWPCVHSSARR